jgi:hypothetical protein
MAVHFAPVTPAFMQWESIVEVPQTRKIETTIDERHGTGLWTFKIEDQENASTTIAKQMGTKSSAVQTPTILFVFQMVILAHVWLTSH